MGAVDIGKLFFDATGRSSRLQYVIVLGGSLAISLLLSVLISVVVPELAILFGLPLIPIWLIAHIRRLHDLGLSAWFVLIIFIPLIGLVFFLYMLLAPGKKPEVVAICEGDLAPECRVAGN